MESEKWAGQESKLEAKFYDVFQSSEKYTLKRKLIISSNIQKVFIHHINRQTLSSYIILELDLDLTYLLRKFLYLDLELKKSCQKRLTGREINRLCLKHKLSRQQLKGEIVNIRKKTIVNISRKPFSKEQLSDLRTCFLIEQKTDRNTISTIQTLTGIERGLIQHVYLLNQLAKLMTWYIVMSHSELLKLLHSNQLYSNLYVLQ